jgi:hypothetical protein
MPERSLLLEMSGRQGRTAVQRKAPEKAYATPCVDAILMHCFANVGKSLGFAPSFGELASEHQVVATSWHTLSPPPAFSLPTAATQSFDPI